MSNSFKMRRQAAEDFVKRVIDFDQPLLTSPVATVYTNTLKFVHLLLQMHP